jgi:hypothetical protein
MMELSVTIGIMVASTLLFVYWFRFTCVLILGAKTAQDFATSVASAHNLSFPRIQARLREISVGEFDGLKDMLDRDYAQVMQLMRQMEAGKSGIEERMLSIHYFLTGVWYRTSARFSEKYGRQALEQMSQVVAHFANSIGEAAAAA